MLLLGTLYILIIKLHTYVIISVCNTKHCFNFSQQVIPDETTQFYALPFAKIDISLASILSKGKG